MLVESVKMIQLCWRRVVCRRIDQKKHAEAIYAATRIQALWRRCSARRSFLELRAATIHLQSCIRSYICKTRYKRLRETVVRTQALVRSKQARIKYSNYKESVVKIQALFRGRRQCRRYEMCRGIVARLQALFRGKREQRKFMKHREAALVIQRHVRDCLFRRKLLKARQNFAAKRIQCAWRSMRLWRAAIIIQAQYRGWKQKQCYLMQVKKIIWLQAIVRGALLRRQLLQQAVAGVSVQPHQVQDLVNNQEICDVPSSPFRSVLYSWLEEPSTASVADVNLHETLESEAPLDPHERQFSDLQRSALRLQRWWRGVVHHRCNAATIIQRHFRGWQERKAYWKKKSDIIFIQALWRGFLVRHRHDNLKEELSALRQRMQITAANADRKLRLEYRLTEALEALLTQKTVSGILHTCATIDLATQHSKLCCERLLEAGAIPKLLQLIQTTNRSPPHEEILKHSLSILGNLARYPQFAILVASAPGSISIIAEQILRNNEEILSKVIKLLQLVCKVPSGLDAVRRKPVVLKRLHNISQVLEKKVEVEARALARLPQTAAPVVRRLGEKKVSDAVAQHHSVVLLLQTATGEDLQTRLKAVKRLSSIYLLPAAPRLSISRFPLQDCSNQ